MPYYALDNKDGSVSVGQSDNPPKGCVFKSESGWPFLAWRPGEHIEILKGKACLKSQADRDGSDEKEPRFSLLKAQAKELVDYKTTEIISAKPGVNDYANLDAAILKKDIDNAVTIDEIRTQTQINIDRL